MSGGGASLQEVSMAGEPDGNNGDTEERVFEVERGYLRQQWK
jgi:hypothetical protein